jgi:hypothetical protein
LSRRDSALELSSICDSVVFAAFPCQDIYPLSKRRFVTMKSSLDLVNECDKYVLHLLLGVSRAFEDGGVALSHKASRRGKERTSN